MSCFQLAEAYSTEMSNARQCAPMLPVVQCTHKRLLMVGCMDCNTFVQNPAQLDAIEAEYTAKKCGVGPCPFFCANAMSGTCASNPGGNSGQCQDVQ